MAKLVLSVEGVIVAEFPLKGEQMYIGRRPQNEIQIDDISVSGQHALLSIEPNAYMDTVKDVYIEDLKSTNGTLVNGKVIKKHMLRHGDVVKIGRHEFKFLDKDAPDFEKTMIISKDKQSANTKPLAKAEIKVMDGPKAGKTLQLIKSYTSLGGGNNLVIISKKSNGYYVSRVTGKGEKTTGPEPTVNGNPIGSQNLPLHDQDVIEISGMRLSFCHIE